MHPEIEILMAIAKDNGELTEEQKENILRQAESLGEDKAEVERLLATISQEISKNAMATSDCVPDSSPVTLPEQTGKERVNKCPHCGAPITDTMLACPECGYTLQRESQASIEARISIEQLRNQLLACDSGKDLSKSEIALSVEKKISLINTFTMPATKEGLMQLLEFAYSNYVSAFNRESDSDDGSLKDAWYGKTLQAYNMLSRLGAQDQEIQHYLQQYSALMEKQNRKLSKGVKETIWSGVGAVVMISLFLVVLGVDDLIDKNKQGRMDEVMDKIATCVQDHDYQGARYAANKLDAGEQRNKLIDEISAQEIVYLLSQGKIAQARSIAVSINKKRTKESMMQVIAEAEETEERNAGRVKDEIGEMRSLNAIFKEVMECIRKEDFQGARAKAGNNQDLLDEIAANEVNWYVIRRDFESAKKVAVTVHDEEKKEKLLNDIWEHEFNQ